MTDDPRGVGFRWPALAGVGLLTFSYVSVLYHVTDVVGGAMAFLALVAGTLGLSVVTARLLRPRTAGLLAGTLLAGGFLAYLLSVPESQRSLLLSGRIVSDTVALLTGLTVIRLTNAGVWAMAVAPAPVFASWYLATRERYVGSVAAGGVALGLFVLTGDAGLLTTLAGVVGGAAAVGLGTMARYGATPAQLDALTAVLATMVVVSASLSVLPGSAAGPLAPQAQSPTVESSVVEAQDSVDVLGSIRLSPQVRFTVESSEGRYWQTAAYDRYTGSGWVRTGKTRPYDGRLASPPGDSRRVVQRVTARTPLGSLPAAWRPVSLDGSATETALVTPQGGVRPSGAVATDETYTVTSRVPQYTETELRRAGTDYPTRIERAYLQLPDSTPNRVRERAAEVTADAETPYGKAVAVEDYLEAQKNYSLTVDRPEGAISDAFLFEMEAGYCTYYATTMVTMLRSQGVPARFVVGYTDGERVDGRHVVRGLDSHAWVQVYFPEVGWVNFDPTPAGPRREAESTRLSEARQSGLSGVDTTETEPTTPTPSPQSRPDGATTDPNLSQSTSDEARIGGANAGTDGGDGGISLPTLPSERTLALWAVALAGALAVGRRTGLTAWLAGAVRLRYQRRTDDPDADVLRAYRRLERHLGRRYRPRRPGETPRAYVEAVVPDWADERDPSLAVLDAFERARYGDGVDPATAEDSVARVDRLTRRATPLFGRFVD